MSTSFTSCQLRTLCHVYVYDSPHNWKAYQQQLTPHEWPSNCGNTDDSIWKRLQRHEPGWYQNRQERNECNFCCTPTRHIQYPKGSRCHINPRRWPSANHRKQIPTGSESPLEVITLITPVSSWCWQPTSPPQSFIRTACSTHLEPNICASIQKTSTFQPPSTDMNTCSYLIPSSPPLDHWTIQPHQSTTSIMGTFIRKWDSLFEPPPRQV